jgi:hypothetical protein
VLLCFLLLPPPLLLLLLLLLLQQNHQIHQVVEGFEVVKAIEGCGSRSGETAYDVMVAGCGQLPKGEGQ